MRVIKYTVTADGHVSPATKQWAGVQGEHNATRIDFDYSAFANKMDNAMWRIDFDSAEAGFDPNNTVYPASVEDIISREIPQKFTKFGGDMTAILVGTETAPDGSGVASKIVCSIPVSLYFTESETHEQTEGEVAESLSQMERHVLDVTEKAENNISKSEKNALDTVAEIQEKLDNGDFKGEKGDKGDKGDKGESGDDYTLTEKDKNDIADLAAEKIDVSGKQEKFAEVIENADGRTLEVLKKLLIMYESNEDFRANAYLMLDRLFAQLKANTVDLCAFGDLMLTANDIKFISDYINFYGSRLQNVGTPTSSTDAANKQYVDNTVPSVDKTYNPESGNAQSGKAVAEAVNKPWTLIEDITLSEPTTSVTIPKEKLQFKEVRIEALIIANDTSTTSQSLQISNGGSTLWQGASNPKSTGKLYVVLDLYISPDNKVSADGTISAYNYSASGMSFNCVGYYMLNDNYAFSVIGDFTAVSGRNTLYINTGVTDGFGIGTRIKVWGR